jgi:sugar phosphate permease
VTATRSPDEGRRGGLPALIVGSSVFLQLHLVLGLLLGPLADRAFNQAKGPALIAAAVLAAGTVVFWRVRRRNRAVAPGAWMEASCPACLGVSLLTGRVPGLAGLAAQDPVRAEPGDEPKVLVR